MLPKNEQKFAPENEICARKWGTKLCCFSEAGFKNMPPKPNQKLPPKICSRFTKNGCHGHALLDFQLMYFKLNWIGKLPLRAIEFLSCSSLSSCAKYGGDCRFQRALSRGGVEGAGRRGGGRAKLEKKTTATHCSQPSPLVPHPASAHMSTPHVRVQTSPIQITLVCCQANLCGGCTPNGPYNAAQLHSRCWSLQMRRHYKCVAVQATRRSHTDVERELDSCAYAVYAHIYQHL